MDCRGQGGMSEDLGGVLGTTVCGHLMIGIDDELDQMYYRKVYLDAYLLSKLDHNYLKLIPKNSLLWTRTRWSTCDCCGRNE